ncbi:hypothetical protein KY346_04025 [Candidatus Woesearchaeota archaeon]|nr:hypothetical protein [Candidatus Woesearchaeota archaeon]
MSRERIITAYLLLILIALIGGFLAFKAGAPVSGSVVVEIENPVITITSFEAVFDPDGTTSMQLVASAKEKINLGESSSFTLVMETSGQKIFYEGVVLFDKSVGKIKSLKQIDDDVAVNIKEITGTVAVTNALDDTASILVKMDFKRPVAKKIFVPPRKLLVNFDFTAAGKTFVSKVLPIRHSEKPIQFPYYLNNFDIFEIKA